MAYVYIHIREDNDEIFYVGISKQNNLYKRAFFKHRKNDIWNKIIKKTNYKVKILHDNLTLNEAKELEIKLIKEYGRINLGNGTLANLTDGGDGLNSYVFNEEQKKKMSLSQKNLYLNGYVSPKKGKKISDETKVKMSKSLKGKTAWNKGIKMSDERKLKFSRLNTKHSQETKNKISESNKGKTRNAIKLLNTETGEVFSSMKEAYIKYNIPKATFHRRVNKNNSIYKRIN